MGIKMKIIDLFLANLLLRERKIWRSENNNKQRCISFFKSLFSKYTDCKQ